MKIILIFACKLFRRPLIMYIIYCQKIDFIDRLSLVHKLRDYLEHLNFDSKNFFATNEHEIFSS